MNRVLFSLCLLVTCNWTTLADDLHSTGDLFRTPVPFVDAAGQPDSAPIHGGMADGTSLTSVLTPVAAEAENNEDPYRFYLSKVLGITFANVRTSVAHAAQPVPGTAPAWNNPTSNNGSLFTAALAGGIRVPLEFGAIRFECEGALRDNFDQSLNPLNQTLINVRVNDNWTALANLWRDVPLTQRLGAYAGGGIGGGGYKLEAFGPGGEVASNQTAVFAWQAGGGLVWRYNSLIDLDLSYRFLDYGQVAATLNRPAADSLGSLSSKMSANEVFFMLRIYEPFQWRKHLWNRAFYLPQ
jgi:opacity protein-like surface antigen